MKKTLLEKAREHTSLKKYVGRIEITGEDIELAVAFMNGNLRYSQLVHAYETVGKKNIGGATLLFRMSSAIRKGIAIGKIKLEFLKK